jgi:hypothetical protein
MDLFISRIIEALTTLIWIATWFVGGFLIVVNTMKIRRHEATLLGFGVGLVLQVWLANWTGRFLEPTVAFWISSILILILGVILTFTYKNFRSVSKKLYFPLGYWLAFIFITYIFFIIGRGLAIFDDYQNLPVTSYIASGAIPPHFVLNPEISFDYHYLMLLNAAQWMRIADLFPWTALDLTRAIYFGLFIVYSAFFGRRITQSWIAGWLTAIFVAFAGGVRWFLLFFPETILAKISDHITMIGTGLQTANNLSEALIKNWVLEGVGPIDFPFAFGNGFHTPSVMKHDGTGLMGLVIALLIILFFEKWKNTFGKIMVSSLLAAMALIDEIWFVFFIFSALVVFIPLILQKKQFPKKEIYTNLLLFVLVPVLFAIVQGGVLTGVFQAITPRISGTVESTSAQYFSFNFPVRWPPAIISAHFGTLFLTNWAQLIVAICEVGPVLFVVPLFLIFGIKAIRFKKLIFSILVVAVVASLLTIFVEYQGSAGISASKRLTLFSIDLLILFSVPLLWYWLRTKKIQIKFFAGSLACMSMVGGLVYFSIQSISIQKPVLSYFIQLMDASVQNLYWDKLEKNAMVFDLDPKRSATIFARPLKSNLTWYQSLPEHQKLARNPDPYRLNDAGYRYVYFSRSTWRQLSSVSQDSFSDSCVEIIYDKSDWQGDFRQLLDIKACKK